MPSKVEIQKKVGKSQFTEHQGNAPQTEHVQCVLFHSGGREIWKMDEAQKQQQFPAPMGRSSGAGPSSAGLWSGQP